MNHIVIDLEMNKITKQIRDSYKLSSELIEIGAVKMNGAFDVVDTYQTYVSPDFGKMDEKIIQEPRELEAGWSLELIGQLASPKGQTESQ